MEDTNNDKDKGNDIRVRSSRRNTHVSRQTEKNLKYRKEQKLWQKGHTCIKTERKNLKYRENK